MKLKKRFSIAPSFKENHDARPPQDADVWPPEVVTDDLRRFPLERHDKTELRTVLREELWAVANHSF